MSETVESKPVFPYTTSAGRFSPYPEGVWRMDTGFVEDDEIVESTIGMSEPFDEVGVIKERQIDRATALARRAMEAMREIPRPHAGDALVLEVVVTVARRPCAWEGKEAAKPVAPAKPKRTRAPKVKK